MVVCKATYIGEDKAVSYGEHIFERGKQMPVSEEVAKILEPNNLFEVTYEGEPDPIQDEGDDE